MGDILYIVVPCYNEEEVLPETSKRLKAKLEGMMAAGKIAEAHLLDQAVPSDFPHPVFVEGVPFPYRGYYTPRDRHGNGIDIRKVKSLVNDKCTDCKTCADVCPMGSISRDNVREYTGICIKCGACIKKCPEGARYYVDEGYLYHQQELEAMYGRRAEPVWFL